MPRRRQPSLFPLNAIALLLCAIGGFPLPAVDVDLGDLQGFLSPGALSAVHAEWDNGAGCAKCHRGKQGLSNALCLDCHPRVARRQKERQGYHGKIEGDCHSCHTDHRGRERDIVVLDAKAFNHDETLYKLSGAHRALECAKCHAVTRGQRKIQKTHYLEMAQRCADCHKDQHEGQFEKTCAECHTETSWKRPHLLFDHQTMSSYPLEGRHRDVACVKCHKEMKEYRPLKTGCRDCHDDPHKGQFDRASASGGVKDCQACHDLDGWKGARLNFDHDRDSRYRLTGAHLKVKCEQCHENGAYRHAKTACLDCHKDPHAGQFAQATAAHQAKGCETCHATPGWKAAHVKFNHDRDSRFELDGAHLTAACAKCHEKGRYRTDQLQCRDCHEDVHKGQFAADKTCTACHLTNGWKGVFLRFDHQADSRYPLDGAHKTVACVECHEKGRYRLGQSQCAACHKDVHLGRLEESCETCHVTQGFKPPHLRFDHDRQTSFTLTALHARAACRDCHADQTFQSKGAACKSCHDPVEAFFAGAGFPALLPPSPDAMHGRVRCLDCHRLDDPKAAAELVRARCVACHNRIYGQYLSECRSIIARRLRESAAPPAVRDAIRRFAPHNFSYALKLLNALDGGK